MGARVNTFLWSISEARSHAMPFDGRDTEWCLTVWSPKDHYSEVASQGDGDLHRVEFRSPNELDPFPMEAVAVTNKVVPPFLPISVLRVLFLWIRSAQP